MKRLLLILVLVVASLPVFADTTLSDIGFDKYELLGTSIYDLVSDSEIDVEKNYNDSGDLVSVIKSAMIIRDPTTKGQENLKNSQFGAMRICSKNNSNLIDEVDLMILGFEEQNKGSLTHIAKLIFGSANSNKINTSGSKNWPDKLVYLYSDIYDEKKLTIMYYESSDYHLDKENGTILLSLNFTN